MTINRKVKSLKKGEYPKPSKERPGKRTYKKELPDKAYTKKDFRHVFSLFVCLKVNSTRD